MSSNQQVSPQFGQFLTERRTSNGRESPSTLTPASDGFDTWWQKTFAVHTAVVAQASALVRAHRRFRTAGVPAPRL